LTNHLQLRHLSRVQDAQLRLAQLQEHHAASLLLQNQNLLVLVKNQMQDIIHFLIHLHQAATLEIVHLILDAVNFQDKME